MIRRSGARSAVKRSKFSRVMPRRAASGHIAATQVLKFPAASRIAAAVINGWPEAPSSPLQGGAPLPPGAGAGEAGAGLPFDELKILSRKFSGPPPDEDCASAGPDHSATPSAAAMIVRFRRAVVVSVIRIADPTPKRVPAGPQEASLWFPSA